MFYRYIMLLLVFVNVNIYSMNIIRRVFSTVRQACVTQTPTISMRKRPIICINSRRSTVGLIALTSATLEEKSKSDKKTDEESKAISVDQVKSKINQSIFNDFKKSKNRVEKYGGSNSFTEYTLINGREKYSCTKHGDHIHCYMEDLRHMEGLHPRRGDYIYVQRPHGIRMALFDEYYYILEKLYEEQNR